MRYHVICESDLYPFASLFVLVKLTKANMSDCLTDVGLVADADAVTAVREYDYDSFSIDLRDGSIFLIYPFEFWERSGELPW